MAMIEAALKNRMNAWLCQRTKARGILACGIRYPDQTSFSQTYSEGLPLDSLDLAWRAVGKTNQLAMGQKWPASKVKWVFEKVLLYSSTRSDGISLGVVTGKKILGSDLELVEKLLKDFQAMRE